MPRDTPPFRADHVGSLLRPPTLLQARADHETGAIDDAELRSAEDEAIREAVALQRDAGLQSATDGEFRRASWHMDFIYRLDGIAKAADDMKIQFKNAGGGMDFTPAALKVEGPIGLSETIFGDDFSFLAETAEGVTPKLTIPSPSMVHYRGGAAAIDPDVYADTEAFWGDLTAAYRQEIARIHDLGCTYLQLDDT